MADAWHLIGSIDADFTAPVTLAEGTWAKDRNVKKVDFTTATSLSYVRLYIYSHHGDAPANAFGSAAGSGSRATRSAPAVIVRPDGGAQEATPGGGFTVDVTGMRPGTAQVQFYLTGGAFSVLGTLKVRQDGKATESFAVPQDAEGARGTCESPSTVMRQQD